MAFLLVGIGGIFGSLARYQLGKIISGKLKLSFPIGTFIINVSGALLLGIISSMEVSRYTYLSVAEGFLGAYTTFSTFMYEGFNLIEKNEKLNAFIYIIGSLVVGLTGFAAGMNLGKLLA